MRKFTVGILAIWPWISATVFAAGAAPVGSPAATQEDVVQTIRETIVRTAPKADAPVAFTVPAGAELTWVVSTRKDGFYRVIRRGKGPQGWAADGDLKLVHEHQPAAPEDDKACAPSLDQCPAHGCAAKDTPEAGDNEMKRARPLPGKAALLTFADFGQLQDEADALVGEGPNDLTPPQRAQLRGLKVSIGTVSEGDLVRLIAYIAKGGEGLHANLSGESVNCMLKKDTDNDFHIPAVNNPVDTEYQGVVVEMIPQERPAAWNMDALKAIQAKGEQVWIEGALSYDKVHYVNADPYNPFKDEPDRMSLWEIHPITKFLVCHKDHCDPDDEKEWSALDAK